MPIQLIITGDHITDVFAEITNFASAIGAPSKNVCTGVGATKQQNVSTASAPSTQAPAQSTSTAAPVAGGKTADDGKLTREQQDAAVEEMVAAGEKDARYEQLTKGRQKAVDDGIAEKAAPAADEKAEEDLNDMFGDDNVEQAAPEVTSDTIRNMMAKLGKDADGNPVQENLLKIRDILTKFVTKGKEIKVGNIPTEKLATVYAELQKLEA
jgi:uncharacterized protein YpuA (DUF1002 family)